MHDIEKRKQFIQLRAANLSFRTIAKKIGVARSTLCNWESTLETEIKLCKKDEIDGLCESYHITVTSRIKRLGELANKLEDEIRNRDLSDVATDKLISLYCATIGALKNEIPEGGHISTIDLIGHDPEVMD